MVFNVELLDILPSKAEIWGYLFTLTVLAQAHIFLFLKIISNSQNKIDADFENAILIAKICQMSLPNSSKPNDSWPDVIYNG